MEQEFSHLDKIYWPKEKLSKGELLDYYRAIAKIILPHISNRAISLNRYPEGIEGENFYQKDVGNLHLPKFTSTKTIRGVKYLVCDNLETLLYIVNLGSIEINVWLSGIDRLEKPDFLLIDLDPQSVDFSVVAKVALECKKICDDAKIPTFLKTTGQVGLHIAIPLGGKYSFDQSKKLARRLAEIVNKNLPTLTSLERHPQKRRGKVYLDYLQNEHGQTVAAPYSPRPFPGAQVSAPLTWEELAAGAKPADFTIKNMPVRLKKVGDLWKPLLHHRGIDLKQALARIGKIFG